MPQDLVEPEELTLEDGEFLVKLARESVEKYFVNETPDFSRVPEKLKKKGAAFVTIEKIIGDKKQLRGCIGYVEPIKPLYKTVYEVALAAAFEDPRFPPVRASELPFLVYEVSVLSSIKKLMGRPEERPRLIKIGKMGLIAKKGFFSGLLLPQVPVEEGWDEETFLAYTCLKAGLSSDCWLDESVEFYYFTARVFSEEYPNGRVVEKELGK
jgi:uncharacterized protein (TIGR00296 family)